MAITCTHHQYEQFLIDTFEGFEGGWYHRDIEDTPSERYAAMSDPDRAFTWAGGEFCDQTGAPIEHLGRPEYEFLLWARRRELIEAQPTEEARSSEPPPLSDPPLAVVEVVVPDNPEARQAIASLAERLRGDERSATMAT